jgi:hypothetical protein
MYVKKQMPKVLMNLSVRRKLALLAIVPCVAALLITCLAIGGYEVLAFRSGVVEDLSATAESIAYSSSAALAFRDEAGATRILGSLSANRHIVGAGRTALNYLSRRRHAPKVMSLALTVSICSTA